MKKTIHYFKEMKASGKGKIAILTAYDYSTAKMLDSCAIDGILVGDSLGMTCLGYKDTLSVTMEDMLHHTKAVARGVENALVIADMPFMSYQVSTQEAVRNAGQLIQEGRAQAVKLEGGTTVLRQIRAIVKAQIPVMGHLGLTPQSVNMFGGYKVQGRAVESAQSLLEDAKKIEDAGVFAVVLECIPMELAEKITKAVSIPTIGIGAGAACDGQVLVYHDMMGMQSEKKLKHVKVFGEAGDKIKQGIYEYIDEVKNGLFPKEEHSFQMSPELVNKR